MGDMALDATGKWRLAEAALHGKRAAAARERERSGHLDRLPPALAAVQAGDADGITYVLTENDPFAAIDLDHCRDVTTHSIDTWAQNFLDTGRHQLFGSDTLRDRLPHLGSDKRR